MDKKPHADLTWVNPKLQTKGRKRDRNQDMEEQKDYDEQEQKYDKDIDEESEDQQEEEEQSEEPPKENQNKGKDLRKLLANIRKKKEEQPELPKEAIEVEQESEEDQAYNSDTFGEVSKPKFGGKRGKQSPGVFGEATQSKSYTDVKDLPEVEELSDNDASEEEKAEIEIPSEEIKLPTNFIRSFYQNAFEKIRALTKK